MSLKDEILALGKELNEPKLYAIASKIHIVEFTLTKTQEELKTCREAAQKAIQAKIDSIPSNAAGHKNAVPEGLTEQTA